MEVQRLPAEDDAINRFYAAAASAGYRRNLPRNWSNPNPEPPITPRDYVHTITLPPATKDNNIVGIEGIDIDASGSESNDHSNVSKGGCDNTDKMDSSAIRHTIIKPDCSRPPPTPYIPPGITADWNGLYPNTTPTRMGSAPPKSNTAAAPTGYGWLAPYLNKLSGSNTNNTDINNINMINNRYYHDDDINSSSTPDLMMGDEMAERLPAGYQRLCKSSDVSATPPLSTHADSQAMQQQQPQYGTMNSASGTRAVARFTPRPEDGGRLINNNNNNYYRGASSPTTNTTTMTSTTMQAGSDIANNIKNKITNSISTGINGLLHPSFGTTISANWNSGVKKSRGMGCGCVGDLFQ